MGTKLKEITNFIEYYAPKKLAESWDNIGLMIGGLEDEISKVLLCLDVTSPVIDEAVENNINLVISHHPFIFKNINRINKEDILGEKIYKLIKHNISVYSAHTNLDFTIGGINDHLAKVLGLENIKILSHHKFDNLYKIIVYVPEKNMDDVRIAMSKEGAGHIGQYSECSFAVQGTGTFRPLEGANPHIGSVLELEKVNEYRLETIVKESDIKTVVEAMKKAHPYEEVAYDIFKLEIPGQCYGMGNIGVLEHPLNLEEFILLIKNKLNTKEVRVIGKGLKPIKNVAVFCGSFDDSLIHAIKNTADIIVTGDIKYHSAILIQELGMCAIDAGHFSTEKIILPKLKEILSKEFSKVKFDCSKVERNPFMDIMVNL